MNNKNIILIGLGGCGKTTVAKSLSRKTGRNVYDVDYEVFAMTGKTPAEIVLHEGEAAFRTYEKKVVERLQNMTGCVISAGVGTVADADNLVRLQKNGLFVYLNRIVPTEKERGLDTLFSSVADLTVSEPTADEAADSILNRIKI